MRGMLLNYALTHAQGGLAPIAINHCEFQKDAHYGANTP